MITGNLRVLGVSAVIAAAVLWGATGTIQALLPPDREPLAVAAARLAIGAAALALLAAASPRGRQGVKGLPLGLILAAGAAIGLYNIFFFVAVSRAGVGVGTALAIGSGPVWATLFAYLFLQERPGRRRLIGQGVAIAGATLLAVAGGTDGAASPIGVALALGAGACYAGYSLLTGRISVLRPDLPTATIAAATFAVAALLAAPAFLLTPTAWMTGTDVWAALLFLGVAVTGLSYALYTWGLRYVAPAAAVTLALAEPLTAWLLATTVVGEALTPAKGVGAGLLLMGLWIVTTSVASKPASPRSGRGGGSGHTA